jgi:hypothetical protein
MVNATMVRVPAYFQPFGDSTYRNPNENHSSESREIVKFGSWYRCDGWARAWMYPTAATEAAHCDAARRPDS